MIGGPEALPRKAIGKRPSFSVQPVMRKGRLIMLRIERRALPVAQKPQVHVAIAKGEPRPPGRLAQDVMRLLRNRPSALWGCKR